ncbi:DUF4157 domain-containing protein [Aquimarina sp. 2201CG5-10]|uniref:DUF4157 domain-containing protein n=1 Tax=Aquimarina callyspongiae TaxID=3098150 RepID=UPI002AB49FB5|nr:DUF4157 domain-containing protein [Aquimarina sp. 2201CG5-10]MDY8138081.1 DUF4157 domain-containing protein [Aquimarina sp. 2201CG5-10]
MFRSANLNNSSATSHNSSPFKGEKDDSAFIQPKLNMGKTGDKYEVEADRMADTVVAKGNDTTNTFFSPSPVIQKQQEETEQDVQQKPLVDTITPLVQKQSEEETEEIQKQPEEEIQKKESIDRVEQVADSGITTDIQKQEEEVQEKEEEEESIQEKSFLQKSEDHEADESTSVIQQKSESVSSNETRKPSIESRLNSSKGGGSPLPEGARNQMESGFGADFGNVRVHTDSSAVQMNRDLGAQAFTHGNDIYFNEGKYDTSSNSGQHLLAHELTHTVQQSDSVQRKPEISKTSNSVQLLPGFIASRLNEYARFIPGYSLLTVIIGYNPILGADVQRTPTNIVEGLLELVPIWGVLLVNKLREYNALQTAFDWIEGELTRLNLTTSRIESLINQAWDDMDFLRLDPFDYNVGVLVNTFQGLYNDVVSFADSLKDQVLGFIKDAVVSPLVGFLEANSPTYVLATKVLGRKFPLDEEVNAPTVEILEDFLVLIGKETEVEEMKNKGTLQETADWIDTQLATFFALLGRFNALFTRAWDAFSLENLRDIPAVFSGILTDFGELLQDFSVFAAEVAIKVLEIIKNALLAWLSTFADDIPGFHLLTVIIRRNPFTGEAVARTTENIIRGFMGLVPGGEAKFQELQQTGVVTNAAQRIDALVARLGISVAFIVQLFTDVWNSVSIQDLISPIETFQRIAAQFGEPISRLFTFVVEVVKIIIELILAMMNFPTELIGSIIANTVQAFNDIKRDPVAFLLNLIAAVKQGFIQFFNNIVNHLLGGLQKWLFGELGEAGIQPPPDISFQSILGMSMEILGITVDNILDRLALKIGQDKVDKIRAGLDMLTGIWTFVKDVIERGPIAIWEYIQEKISNLWNVVVDGIKGWIMTTIIQRVTTKLLSMLDPTGIMAVVNSAIAFFNAVQSFIEKLREMLEILNSFIAGVAEIARGSIASAANFLESALADGIPVAISFLANQVGLGNLGEKISEMIELAREKINEGIDWLIDKAMAAGTAFLNMLGLGGGEEGEGEEEADDGSGLELGSVEATFQDEEEEDHRLYITVQGTNATVMMASNNPDDLHNKIQNEQTTDETDTPEQEAELVTADQLRAQLVTYIETNLLNSEDQDMETVRAEIQRRLNEIRDKVVQGGIDSDGELPATEVTHGMQGDKAGMVAAYPLTNKAGNTTGAAPGGLEIQGWSLVRQYDYIFREQEDRWDSQFWIRFHLLHDGMHGPATLWNLVPAHTRDNRNRYLPEIETPILNQVNDGKIMFFDVRVSGYHNGVPDLYANHEKFKALSEETQTNYHGLYSKFPTQLTVNAGYLEKNGDGFTEGEKIHDNRIFTFEESLDIARDPNSIKIILNKASGELSGLGIASGNQAYLTGTGRSKTNVNDLVNGYFTDPTERNVNDVISYLGQIIGALNNTDEAYQDATIQLFDTSTDKNADISAIESKIESLQTISQKASGALSLIESYKNEKGLSQRALAQQLSLGMNEGDYTFEGIDFKLKNKGASTIRMTITAGNQTMLPQYLCLMLRLINKY